MNSFNALSPSVWFLKYLFSQKTVMMFQKVVISSRKVWEINWVRKNFVTKFHQVAGLMAIIILEIKKTTFTFLFVFLLFFYLFVFVSLFILFSSFDSTVWWCELAENAHVTKIYRTAVIHISVHICTTAASGTSFLLYSSEWRFSVIRRRLTTRVQVHANDHIPWQS